MSPSTLPESFYEFDYKYLSGNWEGPRGAAFNTVAEDCRTAGWGTYGFPTEKGKLLMDHYERTNLGLR